MGGLGYIAMAIAVVFFGSNFVPVKKFDAGDGFIFQWIMCASIWVVGLVVQCIRDSPTFWPFAMLGGVIWATGNITVVPIVNLLGLGLGLLTWGLSNMLMGWATSKFGFFGIEKNTFTHQGQILNYAGIVVAVLSMIPYVLIRPSSDEEVAEEEREAVPLVSALPDLAGKEKEPIGPIEAIMARTTPRNRRIFGFVLALFAGLCYGSNFDPPMIIMAKINRHEPGYTGSTQGIDYVFSHFCGIFLASTVYMALYCAYRRNKPFVNKELILPGLASGLMWAIAQVCFFIANSELGASIVFPVLGTGPGVVGALWSVFVFGEIKGRWNYIYLSIAIALTFVGVGLITASKL